MNNLLKLLKLSQKSGDRFVIYNPEDPDNSWVAISLDEYEKLVGNKSKNIVVNKEEITNEEKLTGEEASDKINLDKKEEIEDKKNDEEYDLEEIEANIKRPVYSDSSDSLSSIKDVIEERRGGWKIPSEIKNSASEVVSE
ncbi:hypothetical protein EOL94_02465 [bacterium]|nr:hypothetical protein [bacterium]